MSDRKWWKARCPKCRARTWYRCFWHSGGQSGVMSRLLVRFCDECGHREEVTDLNV